MPDFSLVQSAVKFIQPLIAVFRFIGNYLGRIQKERQAGRTLFSEDQHRLLDVEFDKTIARLRGVHSEDGWLRPILTSLEHPIVTPQFLSEPEVQEWLADDRVRDDLKFCATAKLLGTGRKDRTVEGRLIQAYSSVSSRPPAFAVEAINGIVDILVAGVKASLPAEIITLAGLMLAASGEQRELLEKVHDHLSGIQDQLNRTGPDELTARTHTTQASQEIDRILKRRTFLTDQARVEIRLLLPRILSGDLHFASHAVKAKALYWSARLCASDPEHIANAKVYVAQLRAIDPRHDTRIVDALILEREGNVNEALRLLRDIDTDDGHSNFWLLLCRTQSKQAGLTWFEAQTGHNEPGFFTGIGWQNFAITLAEMGMWEEAAEALYAAQVHVVDWPDLAFIEGVINAAMLLPMEMRQEALRMNIFHAEVQPVRGPEADQRRARARACFEQTLQLMPDSDEVGRAQAAKQWLLWLRLTDNDSKIKQQAQSEVREAMADGRRAIDYLPVALAFGIKFDKGPLQQYLAQRSQTGGLEGQELVSEFLLAETTLSAREYAEFLEREEARLATTLPKSTLAGKRIEALLKDGQVARARHVLETYRNNFQDQDHDRLHALITMKEGGDARTELEALYSRTRDLFDLQNLVGEVGRSKDWTALSPLLKELFKRQRTPGNADLLLDCMHRDPKSGAAAIRSFFSENPDVPDWNNDFKSAKAWADFYCGYLFEARLVNDELLRIRAHIADLELDMNLAIQSGDWERFPAIITREWDRRNSYGANVLLRFAMLAAETDSTTNRAFELAKLAANKAPNDPSVLMNAYSLAVQLGRDHDVDPLWMTRAVELSSAGGPVWKVDLRTLAQEMIPAHRERTQLIERHLLSGEIPLHMAAKYLHMPLSRILIDIPRRNKEQLDGRRRVVIPIASGARQRVELPPHSALGLDITSLMVLSYLDLLHTVLNAHDRILLAPDTMVVLLNERNHVRFHQPSRIQHAQELSSLIDQTRLKPMTSSCDPPAWLVEEVGRDLAELLQVARAEGGRVVRPRPILKLSTFAEYQADMRDYSGLILSTMELARLLLNAGKLDQETYAEGTKYLATRDKCQDMDDGIASSILSAPLYLDDLAITYLQHAGLLQSLCRSGIDLRIHKSMKEEQSALLATGREGEHLIGDIDSIRCALREGMEKGKVVFLPRQEMRDEKIGSFTGFLTDAGTADYVSIDDRFINRHSFITDNKGRNIPIVCVLDLINALETQGAIDKQKKQAVLHRLRAAGFALIPIDTDELTHLVRTAPFDSNGQLTETQELQILRQILMRTRSLLMLQHPLETSYLQSLRLTCILTIRRLWADDTLSIERTRALSDWIWNKITPSPFDWEGNLPAAPQGLPPRDSFTGLVASLLSPMAHVNEARYEAFLKWIEQEVLEPLLPANNSLIDDLAKQLRAHIGQMVERLSSGN